MGTRVRDSEQNLQERLERLEAGEPLEACLSGLSDDEVDSLKLATSLREVQYPERDPDTVTVQRAALLRLAAKETTVDARSTQDAGKGSSRPARTWLGPVAVFSGAMALVCVCVLVAAAGAGLAWWTSRDNVAQNPPPAPGATLEAGLARRSTPEPTPASASAPVPPAVSVPEVRDPHSASLYDVRGVVQVQGGDGTWTAASTGQTVVAGQRVRTGGLSGARLAFYDGSQASLGPHTEVSVDELDARSSGGPRVVVLTQWMGETDHDVVPVGDADAGARYEVRTPSAVGVAQGTSFHVLVTPDSLTRFSVDEGSVAATGLNVTVVVVAGQSTTIRPGKAPGEPVFRITGEGRVTQTGMTWIIAGQSFATHEGTVIVGNPQVGDWVLVEGHLLPDNTRIADLIVLLRRSPADRFTITGRVEVIEDTGWTIAGQTVVVDDATDVDDDVVVGDLARVDGVILEDGVLLAERICRVEEQPGWPFHFVGVVQDIAGEAWTISGVTIAVDAETEIDAGLGTGDVVQVHGWILDDGSWLARSIARVEEGEREFELVGYVESVAPWVVAGIPFETDEWTEIAPDVRPGDWVRVTGRITEDGVWMASEIERLDEDDEAIDVVFVGTVESTDPWVVSGIPLAVDDETTVEGDVDVGDIVKVEARILPDGTWLATRIAPASTYGPGLGCVSISAIVVRVNADQIELLNGPTIPLDDDVAVVGNLAAHSVIVIVVCVDADGTMHIVSIIVIYQLEPPIVIPPTPPVPLPTRPPEEGDSDKVTICHKPHSKHPHTITISRSALQAHLDHGDTMGPCPK